MSESILWLLQMITALILIFAVGAHMIIMHLDTIASLFTSLPHGVEAVEWKAVAQRGRQISFVVAYIIFLAAAIYHGFYGLRNILIEAFSKYKIEKPVGWILVTLGVALFAYGLWATCKTYIITNQ